MKKILGITFGSLQKRMVNLVIMVLLLTIAVFSVVSYYQNKMLVKTVGEARKEQEEAISSKSRESMHQVLKGSLVQSVNQEATIADSDFSEVVNNISMLQTMARGLVKGQDDLTPVQVSPPDLSKEGTYSAMVLCEEGVDYKESEYLGIISHMSDAMIALASNSDKISSCYMGLADGTHLGIDSHTKNKYDKNGNLIPLPVRQRPWYKGAVDTGDIYFTGIEEDAFSGVPGITCSAPVIVDGKLIGVVGIDIVLESMNDFVSSAKDKGGIVFIVNDKGEVVLTSDDSLFPRKISDEAVDLRKSEDKELAGFITAALDKGADLKVLTVGGKEYYMAGAPMPTVGWAAVSAISKEVTESPEKQLLKDYEDINKRATERFRQGTSRTMQNIVMVILILLCLGSFIAFRAARHIVKPIEEITRDINKCGTTGQLFEMTDAYRTNDEIEILAESFADLSRKTKQYIEDITRITREKERVSTELSMANRIQHSMLPNIFPAYPERDEFDIYASMEPAREVGGDFYDFFLIDDDHLCMVMADVSGKGVPAALFMMISKVILQSCAMLGQDAAEILNKTNEAICSSNQEDMFVTVWLGIMEISTGKITAANAGHEYPALMQEGEFELLKDKHGLVIGGMEGMTYLQYELWMNPGDKLFVYTDGVPEAADKDKNMFGKDRMLEALNREPEASPKEIIDNVKDAVENFVMGEEQFDDMTMLCIEYKKRMIKVENE